MCVPSSEFKLHEDVLRLKGGKPSNCNQPMLACVPVIICTPKGRGIASSTKVPSGISHLSRIAPPPQQPMRQETIPPQAPTIYDAAAASGIYPNPQQLRNLSYTIDEGPGRGMSPPSSPPSIYTKHVKYQSPTTSYETNFEEYPRTLPDTQAISANQYKRLPPLTEDIPRPKGMPPLRADIIPGRSGRGREIPQPEFNRVRKDRRIPPAPQMNDSDRAVLFQICDMAKVLREEIERIESLDVFGKLKKMQQERREDVLSGRSIERQPVQFNKSI